MNLIHFLEELKTQSITLFLDGERLRYHAPKQALTPDILSKIKQYKSDIIERLQGNRDDNSASDTYPLSQGQRAMWFLYQLAPESVAYNVRYIAYLQPDLEISVLQQAFEKLVERHAIFRTTYMVHNGEPIQQIHKHKKIDFEVIKADNWNQEDLNKWLDDEADRPFNLEQGPLLRVNVLTGFSEPAVPILLLTTHHICGDFWSLGILINELEILYQAIKIGKPATLSTLKWSYKDYVRWEIEMLAGSRGKQLRNYWHKQLSGELPELNLPTDRHRPPVQTYQGTTLTFEFDEQINQQIVDLSKITGITPYVLLFTVFQVLLLRYTGQEDILTATMMSGRHRSELQGIIGYFTNLVVLRTKFQGNPVLKELLDSVRSLVVEALDYQDYPFGLLVEQLSPSRSPSRSPITQVLFVWDKEQNQEISPKNSKKLFRKSLPFEQRGADFDLTLTFFDYESFFTGKLAYNTDIFEESTISRMIGHLKNLVKDVLANPQQRLSELLMLTKTEQQQLLAWNQTETDYPIEKTLVDLFQERVEKAPENIALIFEKQEFTYLELNTKANQLAHYLKTLGVGVETLVGICVERSLEMVIGLLGILKAGGAYVPLDPNYPQQRLQFMLEDSQVSVLLSQTHLLELLPTSTAITVDLDIEWEKIATYSIENPVIQAGPDNLAYVIYTSGSTGKPKGVLGVHRGMVNRLNWMWQTFPFEPQEVCCHRTSINFVDHVAELFSPLLKGNSLVLLTGTNLLDVIGIIDILSKYKIARIVLVPSLLKTILEQDDKELQKLVGMKYWFCSGEALPEQLVKLFYEKLSSGNLLNIYGSSEVSADVMAYQVKPQENVSIGKPISNTQVYILDEHLQRVPIGVPGELYIGGAGLARGYLNRADLTNEKFIKNPFSDEPDARLYKTGDLARYLSDGNIEYLGRVDNQVKLRGFRIELGEIEASLSQHNAVKEAVVVIYNKDDNPSLAAYVSLATPLEEVATILRAWLKNHLPEYMLPASFTVLEQLPLTPNGKIDRKALPNPDLTVQADYVIPQTEAEQKIAQVWQKVLQLEKVGVSNNFFEVGGHSLLMVRVHNELQKIFGQSLSMVELFQYPTIQALAKYLTQDETQKTSSVSVIETEKASDNQDIAIIGMAGRFPGAKNIETFWKNLHDGIESISFFTDEELLANGIDQAQLDNPDYVKANATLEDIELFDAKFFGLSPREAEIMDPQQRIFLECAWEAIEDAGYNVENISKDTGVFAGVGLNHYLLRNLSQQEDFFETANLAQFIFSNDKDFLATRTSYKLNLKGPSIDVQTACSTSLVAVHLARQSLLNGESDVALAGGVSIWIPQKTGYTYQEGMILSADGHCRAFDAKASGTVFGSGVGIVVLKRLEQAIADGDYIHAVIKGSAINNDGALKVGYTAPSVEGQAAVIASAMRGIDYESISYIETHGTGTALGDPIEIAALTQVYRAHTQKQGFCAIGSVKSNVGHLDTAAGVTGLIKTALALKHKVLPPSLHFEQPNPQIDFVNSPFLVNTQLTPWLAEDAPRRAGVSSFGIGGTNVHAVLEEAPVQSVENQVGKNRPWQLLVLSAKTESALEVATTRLAQHLQHNPTLNLAEVAYTLSTGRKRFEHRRMLVGQTLDDVLNILNNHEPARLFTQAQETEQRPVVFMFSGQGSQYVNMALGLYQHEILFREHVDKCAELLKPLLNLDVREVLYPNTETPEIKQQLEQTALTQPALFVVEYALAKLWMAWGVEPVAMIGHSIGEYVAATLAGVFNLEDALSLVAARGKLMQSMPNGSMLAVPLPENEVKPLLEGTSLQIATVNGPTNCVVSGTTEAIEVLEKKLVTKDIEGRRLHTSHAYHSSMMEPILEAFTNQVKSVKLNAPTIPFVSNVTGTWITPKQATEPSYYAQHLRACVRFADGIKQFFDNPDQILLEVGPGHTLSTLAKRHPDKPAEQMTFTSVRHPQEKKSDVTFLLNALGQLWLAGTEVNWDNYYGEEKHSRVPLPTYPFERKRYWIEPNKQPITQKVDIVSTAKETLGKKPDIADWFYVPLWKPLPLLPSKPNEISAKFPILVFVDEYGLGAGLVKQLEAKTEDVVSVKAGNKFAKLDTDLYSINPSNADDYQTLIQTLQVQKLTPKTIVHLWNVTENKETQLTLESVEAAQNLGFYSLLYLTQALGQQNVEDEINMVMVSNHLQNVNGEETITPEKSTLIGPVRVIPLEYRNIHCCSVDVVLSPSSNQNEEQLISQLLNELQGKSEDNLIAYRGGHRWVQTFEPVRLEQPSKETLETLPFKQGGVYLITGGLGGIGLVFAKHLAKTVPAKLILIGRSTLPERHKWEQWLTDHSEEDPTSRKIGKVQYLEELGAEVLVVGADVANQQQMAEAISLAQNQFGQINGVIHSAGVPSGGVIQLKTREIAERVLAPKVQGTAVLDTLFKNVPLDFMVVCSSIDSPLGHFGQVDYCGANNFLDAYAQAKSADSRRLTLSINWDTWQEVGMAVDTSQQGLERKTLEVKKLSHPLFDKCIIEKSQEIYVSKLSHRTHWILGEHIVTGKATLVGTAYLEIARAAYEYHSGQSAIEMQQVYFLERLIVEEDEEKEVRTILTLKEKGVEFSIQSQDSNSTEWRENAKGEIVAIDATESVQYNINDLEAKCHLEATIPDLQSFSGFIQFGPRWWNNMKWLKTGKKDRFSLLELPPEFSNDLKSYKLHPAILDVATGFTGGVKEGNYLPYSYEKVRIKGSLPTKFYTYGTVNEQNDSSIQSLNLSLLDSHGTELIEIENYLQKRVDYVTTDSSPLSIKSEQIENFNLGISEPGILDELAFYPALRQKPGSGEVEIEVFASGLNFKNVLQAIGMINVDPKWIEDGRIIIPGFECAGTIASIGEGVDRFNIGDEVICSTSSSSGFSAFVTTPASSVVPKPAHLSLEAAATIPTAFQTAYYMLREFGRLRKGERILIHAAAGGVGLAAVKIAQMIGAEIFATAGKPEKRDFLKSLGIKYVMDSRSLDFVEQVNEYTDGKGVDVVLNSLAGEFLFKSLSLLAPYGRFLEIGLRDILENSQLGLKAFEKGITVSALQVRSDIPNFNAVFEELLQHFQDGNLSPLPYKVFPITEAISAFQYMAQAQHIGKIILSQNEEIREKLVFEKPERSQQSGKPRKRKQSNPLLAGIDEYGVLNQEGVDSFNRIIESRRTQVIVSTTDFEHRIKQVSLLTQNQSSDETNSVELSSERPHLSQAYEAPQSQIEQTIALIWQEVLGIKNIGIHDNFFDLGGDSLIIVQVRAKLSKRLERDLPITDLLNYTTIHSLAKCVVEKNSLKPKTESPKMIAENQESIHKEPRDNKDSRQQRRKLALDTLGTSK